MTETDTLHAHHVYVAISVHIVSSNIFSCLAIMTTPPGKRTGMLLLEYWNLKGLVGCSMICNWLDAEFKLK